MASQDPLFMPSVTPQVALASSIAAIRPLPSVTGTVASAQINPPSGNPHRDTYRPYPGKL